MALTNPFEKYASSNGTNQQQSQWLADNPAPQLSYLDGQSMGPRGDFGIGEANVQAGNYNKKLQLTQQYNRDYEAWQNKATAAGVNVDSIGGSGGVGDKEQVAMDLANSVWESQQQANEDATADREAMMSELKQIEDAYDERWIESEVSREASAWDVKIGEFEKQTTERYSAMGRVANPLVMGRLKQKMVAQKQSALQSVRINLGKEGLQVKEFVAQMRNDVRKNTTREVMSMQDAMSIISSLGAGDASSQVRTYGGRTAAERQGVQLPSNGKPSVTAQKNRQFAGGSSYGGSAIANRNTGL